MGTVSGWPPLPLPVEAAFVVLFHRLPFAIAQLRLGPCLLV